MRSQQQTTYAVQKRANKITTRSGDVDVMMGLEGEQRILCCVQEQDI